MPVSGRSKKRHFFHDLYYPTTTGREKTRKLVAEAERCVAEIIFEPPLVQDMTPLQYRVVQSTSESQQHVVDRTSLEYTGLADVYTQSSPIVGSTENYTAHRRTSGSGSIAQASVEMTLPLRFDTLSSHISAPTQIGTLMSGRADELGFRESTNERPYESMPQTRSPSYVDEMEQRFATFIGSQRNSQSNIQFSSSSRFIHTDESFSNPPLSAGSQLSSFPTRKSSLAGTGVSASQELPTLPPRSPPLTPSLSTPYPKSSLSPGLCFTASFSEEVESALAQASAVDVSPEGQSGPKQTAGALGYSSPVSRSNVGTGSYGLPKGAAPPNVPHPHTPQLMAPESGVPDSPNDSPGGYFPHQQLQVKREEQSYDSEEETQLAYARDSFDLGYRNTVSKPLMHLGGQSNVPEGVPQDVRSQELEDANDNHNEGEVKAIYTGGFNLRSIRSSAYFPAPSHHSSVVFKINSRDT